MPLSALHFFLASHPVQMEKCTPRLQELAFLKTHLPPSSACATIRCFCPLFHLLTSPVSLTTFCLIFKQPSCDGCDRALIPDEHHVQQTPPQRFAIPTFAPYPVLDNCFPGTRRLFSHPEPQRISLQILQYPRSSDAVTAVAAHHRYLQHLANPTQFKPHPWLCLLILLGWSIAEPRPPSSHN